MYFFELITKLIYIHLSSWMCKVKSIYLSFVF